MENESKREKFLFWCVTNSGKWWMFVLMVILCVTLVNAPFAGFGGLGLGLYGAYGFCVGMNTALKAAKGDDWASKIKEKEKKNDTVN